MVSNVFYFHPCLGKIPILTSIFFRWVVQPPTSVSFHNGYIFSIFLQVKIQPANEAKTAVRTGGFVCMNHSLPLAAPTFQQIETVYCITSQRLKGLGGSREIILFLNCFWISMHPLDDRNLNKPEKKINPQKTAATQGNVKISRSKKHHIFQTKNSDMNGRGIPGTPFQADKLVQERYEKLVLGLRALEAANEKQEIRTS